MYNFYKALFFTNRFFIILIGLGLVSLPFFLFNISEIILLLLIGSLAIFTLMDYWILFGSNRTILAERKISEVLSNGDLNPVEIHIQNQYSFPIHFLILDEIPFQLQIRDYEFEGKIEKGKEINHSYRLRPTKRGEYSFGALNLYIQSPIGLLERKFVFQENQLVPCYPSIIQMRKYAFMVVSRYASQFGTKKIRKLGHSQEFEQIKEYNLGDDIRTVNWKATARKGDLMVNHYTDEKAQPILMAIDKGRAMRMSFNGLSLLDFSINSVLALSNIALLKKDKVGLLTFSDRSGTFIPPNNSSTQLRNLLAGLYQQKSSWGESSYEYLYSSIRSEIKQRTLIILFSEFDSIQALHFHLPYLKSLQKFHLVLVVFFQDIELEEVFEEPVESLKDIYRKTISGKFKLEKQLIAKELNKHGILSLLTSPHNLSVNLINKYFEIKALGKI